jgi:uncharacterized membrane protein
LYMEKEKRIHRLFQVSVLLKGLHAALEIVSGLLILFVSARTITHVLTVLTQDELAEDPHDLVARYLFQTGQHLSVGTKQFGALYLLTHGIVNMGLVVGLLANRLWAYPASLAILGAFVVYQVYRFTHTHALGLIVLTLFDLLVLWLIWHEYSLMRRRRAPK